MTTTSTDLPTVVIHRLALGIELVDRLTGRPPMSRPVVFMEEPDVRFRATEEPTPVLRPLETAGNGRFKIRYRLDRDVELDPHTKKPLSLTLRIVDDSGYHIARRVRIAVRGLWTVVDREQADATVAFGAPYRTLRLVLFPGPTYPLPGGVTALRGQATDAKGMPRAWARVELASSTAPLGWTHADGSGQFAVVAQGRLGGNRLLQPYTVTVHSSAAAPVPVAGPQQRRVDSLSGLPVIDLGALTDPVLPPSAPTSEPVNAAGDYLPPDATTTVATVTDPIRLGRVLTKTLITA